MNTHTMPYRAQLERRLAAAALNGGAQAVTPRNANLYTVTGRAGTRYTVATFGLESIRCDCKAGLCDVPCWHAAAVYLRLVADSARTEARA